MEENLKADNDRLCLTPHEGKYLYGEEITSAWPFVGNGCIQTAFQKDEDNRYAIIPPTQFDDMAEADAASMIGDEDDSRETITFLPTNQLFIKGDIEPANPGDPTDTEPNPEERDLSFSKPFCKRTFYASACTSLN